MLRGRASVALGMIFVAVVVLLAWHLFGTSWSNHYDPGNAQFNGHWTELAPMPNENFAVYQKDTPTGIRLTAVVRSQPFWVEVDLAAPGLHPGENGFT
jgi:hypothetical protein